MKKNSTGLIALFFCFISKNVYAENINVGASLTIPPYVIAETNSGIEVEIVREALIQSSYTMELTVIPLKRIYDSVRNGLTDAGMSAMKSNENADLHFSDSHITYQNVAISLKKNNAVISSIYDLKNYSLLAFQNATEYLGPEFKAVAQNSNRYSERANQDAQVAMLYSGRVDVILIDINIFKSLRKLEGRVDTSAEVVIHEIFPKNDMRVAFKSERVRDDFNSGLRKIKESGKYEDILNKYTN